MKREVDVNMSKHAKIFEKTKYQINPYCSVPTDLNDNKLLKYEQEEGLLEVEFSDGENGQDRDQNDLRNEMITNFNMTITPRLNRAVVLVAHVGTTPVHFAITYNRKTVQVEFQVNPLTLEDGVTYEIFKTLHVSKFCKVFFNLIESDTVTDPRNNLVHKMYDIVVDLKSSYSNSLIKFMTQTVIEGHSEKDLNNLQITGWKIQDANNDFLFYVVQRKAYNSVTRILTSKSFGIQFATQAGLDVLNRYYKNYESLCVVGKEEQNRKEK